VSLSGTLAVVGATGGNTGGFGPGAVYVFDVTTGLQLTKLIPDDGDTGGYSFGSSVAIEGTIVLIGASQDIELGAASGSAYMFDAITGQQLRKLLPGDGEEGDRFGSAVAIDGGIALISASADDDQGTDAGSAYLFDLASGQELFKLLPDDAETFDGFGVSVAIDGGLAVIGASGDDDLGLQSGSAYVFDAATGRQIAKAHAEDGEAYDSFGRTVAIAGSIMTVGAPTEANFVGAAYTFELAPASVVKRNGSGLNASLLTSAVAPVLGSTWSASLDCTGHGAGLAMLALYEGALDGIFLSGGELLVDLTSPEVATIPLPHTGGSALFSVAVPGDAALFGSPVSAQGIVFGAPGYELSNALDLVLGW